MSAAPLRLVGDPVTATPNRGYQVPDVSDAECVRAILDGDDTAFTVLVDRHAPACIRFATRMLGDEADAEDVTQETLLRAYQALSRFDTTMNLRTWIMSILVNRCRSHLLHRRRRAARVVADEAAVRAAAVPADDRDAALRDAIERAVDRLDPAQREAFLLKHVELLTYEEMTAVTGASVPALKMRVRRACERLQVMLQEDCHA
jgi:RNA polymerase sigma-70 factor (ECF subfamily)